eukprot:TRINITY_DN5617_c0_g1_i1.p1 TRINITY_DN5617_c0_g1~~TRINITY_DN5617_c0_g1_i1.p1  ORF type:complete len:126 (-),score=13.11 TRINITY_DN5617_c0_g1_i1:352-729(-)
MEPLNVYYIRHAKSYYNEQFENVAPGNCTDPKLIDCSISDTGKSQVIELKEKLKQMNLKPELIVVSGLSRSIETCLGAIDESHYDKIVFEPTLAEKMEDSCDIGTIPIVLEKKYPNVSHIFKYSS